LVKNLFVLLKPLMTAMNLSIDIGNSRVKLAVFKEYKCLEILAISKKQLLGRLTYLNKRHTIKAAIISSVSDIDIDILKKIERLFRVVCLDANLNLPFTILYKTIETLGVDRLALMAAAVTKYPNQNVLVIDAGTCITYDFITKNTNYLGGAISPGVLMRYKALNNQTEKLPLLTPEQPKSIIGDTTQQSIHSGVCIGVINEIEGVISQYKLKFPNLTVVLTGGDTNFLSEKLKSVIFANPNFLLEGLNHILNHNLQE
jgi:type III pantothenate kinase